MRVAGNVIAVAAAVIDCLRRSQRLAVFTKELASQQVRPRLHRGSAALSALAQALAHRLPQGWLDDRRVLPGMALAMMPDLPDINRIGEQLVQRSARETGTAAAAAAIPGQAALGA